ncbi:unnamed protein product [marine sediment metagenome]|uniref:Uncharacterized protein n=1 Tax=marine sediment metagenome TaxID=412755 RepID=X0YDR9_9ZZZZ
MESLYLFIALIISILANVYQLKLNYKEKKDIFTKYMAKNLAESEYFDKFYPKATKEQIKSIKKEREKEVTEAERKIKEVAGKF